MKSRSLHRVIVCYLTFLSFLPAVSEQRHNSRRSVSTTSGTPAYTFLNINNISTVFRNNGFSDIDTNDQNSRFVFPKGSGKTAVFKSGFLWGARYGVGGEIRVGGSAHRSGLQPGKILSSGIPEDPGLPKNRIYRVRPDYQTADLSAEMADEGRTADAIRAQYAIDWSEWPAADGAPFDDKNGNGVYEPGFDVPGVKDASQTIWFVCNDLDPGLTTNLFGSNPLGIEMQVTIWAYARPGVLGDMFFKKYLLINKNTTRFDSMYVSPWADIDIGNAVDDFAGCDTTLNLAYCYNIYEVDAVYLPLSPSCSWYSAAPGTCSRICRQRCDFTWKRIGGIPKLINDSFLLHCSRRR